MDLYSQLKLQGYLDGELPEAEARGVANWLAKEREAVALHAELRNTRQALVGFEIGITLPESREFYWSKIEREIERQAQPQAKTQSVPLLATLHRFLVPLSGAAVVALLLTFAVSRNLPGAGLLGEVEVSPQDMGAITFRSQSEGMTMVWLYDRTDPQFTSEASPDRVEPE